jgi:hemerythrin superfamily protein
MKQSDTGKTRKEGRLQSVSGNGASPQSDGIAAGNAIAFLKAQHREVEALFAALEKAGDASEEEQEELLARLAEKIEMHAKLEEMHFYPAVKSVDEELVLEAAEEHENIEAMLLKTEDTTAEDDSFVAKVHVLKELVAHHVKEEEGKLFPACEAKLDEDRLMAIADEMRASVEAAGIAGAAPEDDDEGDEIDLEGDLASMRDDDRTPARAASRSRRPSPGEIRH